MLVCRQRRNRNTRNENNQKSAMPRSRYLLYFQSNTFVKKHPSIYVLLIPSALRGQRFSRRKAKQTVAESETSHLLEIDSGDGVMGSLQYEQSSPDQNHCVVFLDQSDFTFTYPGQAIVVTIDNIVVYYLNSICSRP